MTSHRVTRADAEPFLRRLEGRDPAERLRLTREHSQFVDGTRDCDADFGEEEKEGETAVKEPAAPSTLGRRPRITVTTPENAAPRYRKRGGLCALYNTDGWKTGAIEAGGMPCFSETNLC